MWINNFLVVFIIHGGKMATATPSICRQGCPYGSTCDSNTGICRQFRPAADPTTTDRCAYITCPNGQQCDSNTGICRQFRPVTGSSSSDRCAYISCPSGQQCDSNTGFCRQFRGPAMYDSPANRCQNVRCPPGYQCDGNTGVCRRFRQPGAVESPMLESYDCSRVQCPFGTMCDSNTGKCRQFRQPTSFRRLSPASDVCSRVQCPNGYECHSVDGVCRPALSDAPGPGPMWQLSPARLQGLTMNSVSERLICPENSHHVECGSRCAYTCTDLQPPCKQVETDCISTCRCDDGLVQAGAANFTCVPPTECPFINAQACSKLNCGEGMACVDGLCNPMECPPIELPNLSPGCRYQLARNEHNCLMYTTACT